MAAAVVLAACGTKSTTGSGASPSSAPPGATGDANAKVTVAAADIPGKGTVLVNGSGRTLYVLSSEAGGHVTCVDANGCTAVWPDSEIPKPLTGGIAGAGVQAALLGSAKGPTGDSYVTYAGYPLYTFSHDPAAGSAKGDGIASFGGTWHLISPSGSLVAASGSGGSSPASSPAASPAKSSGYGY
ncbi:MAG: hypothetical protein NVSMB32_06350 [Actinomycetota bacterium]